MIKRIVALLLVSAINCFAQGTYVPVAYNATTHSFKPIGLEGDLYNDDDVAAYLLATYPGLATDSSLFMSKDVYDINDNGIADEVDTMIALLAGTLDSEDAPWYNWGFDVDAQEFDLDNVDEGEFNELVVHNSFTLNGVTITSFGEPNPDGTIPLPGQALLRFKYPSDGRWFAGKIRLEVYDNAAMFGWPIYTNIFTTVSLPGDPQYTISLTTAMIGSTYWFAWLDGNGDNVFNDLADISGTTHLLGTEPAALAQFNPQIIDDGAATPVIDFNMVDLKGCSPRLGWTKLSMNSAIDVGANIYDTVTASGTPSFTLTGGGNHGGSAWTPTANSEISGYHYNISTFTVPSGTVYIKPLIEDQVNGGSLKIEAATVVITGTLNGNDAGYPGGNGGGGGGGGRWTGGSSNGSGGSGGHGGNAPGGNGTSGQTESGDVINGGTGGFGARGYGPFAGTKESVPGHGYSGGYNARITNGQGLNNVEVVKSTTVYVGSGGAGGWGSNGQGMRLPGSLQGATGGGGGGGAGGHGGAKIELIATTSITVPGAIRARGGNNASNGSSGSNRGSINTAGNGGNGGYVGFNGLGDTGNGGFGGISEGNLGVTFYPQSSWAGGLGSGGGILLYAPSVTVAGTVDVLAPDQVNNNAFKAPDGTIKIFYDSTLSIGSGTFNSGNYYEYQEDMASAPGNLIFSGSLRNRLYVCEADYLGGLAYEFPYNLLELQLFELPSTTATLTKEFYGVDVYGNGSNQDNNGETAILTSPDTVEDVTSSLVTFVWQRSWKQYSSLNLECYLASTGSGAAWANTASTAAGDLSGSDTIKPNTVVFTCTKGDEAFVIHDDGLGNLSSANGAIGTINYTTCVYSIDFGAVNDTGSSIAVTYNVGWVTADVTPVYSYVGYMENENQDGETKHLMRPATGGPELIDDSWYYWRLRSIPMVDGTTMPQGDWSDYSLFRKIAE